MPSKYQEYRQMADTAERQLTSSYKSWTQFQRTAARLYKYPYNEQVMIHAQRPDATACAEYDFWNKKMGRFVRRGSTGIALIDTSGQKPQLRYYDAHESDIIIHKAAKRAFDDLALKKLPAVKSLQEEYAKLLAEKKAAYAAYRRSRDEMRELLLHKQNVDRMLGKDERSEEKKQEHDRQ